MISFLALGAGQDVGRSCLIVTIGNKNIMFDCGMHMGYNNEKRFPDFSYLTPCKNFDRIIDCVIISHFHLDHCGALPYFTEVCGYHGPIYMTHPTKAICPILIEDCRKIIVDRKGETNFFSSKMISDCMRKVTGVNLHETIQVDDDFEIRAYYAGHVLGAAMFYVKVQSEIVIYTGDYNMTPDQHLGAGWIDRLRPDLLITETTYCTTLRDSRRSRELDFLTQVNQCVHRGGKVLIPVFALGRAQELCILVENYWERMNIDVPVYFSAGLTEKANHFYKIFTSWMNESIRHGSLISSNKFDFKRIKPFDRSLIDADGPMVLFASPGMLHSGTSLDIFKKWCSDPKNLVIIPGYCVEGTIGSRILKGERKIQLDNMKTLDVQMQIKHLSFSAHADLSGILRLIDMCEPKNIVFVHGEKKNMKILEQKIRGDLKIPCFYPKNGSLLNIKTKKRMTVKLHEDILTRRKTLSEEDWKDVKDIENKIFDSIDGKSLEFNGILRLDSRINSLVLDNE